MRTFTYQLALSLFATALLACGGTARESAAPVAGTATIADQPMAHVDGDWPQWRGPTRDGVAPDSAAPPLSWGEGSNVVWTADVPGEGHASPVVCGDRVVLAVADREAGTQSLVCYATGDGAVRWTRQLHQGKLPRIHGDNSHASPTPACDGERVYAVFAIDGEVRLSAVALDSGEIVWSHPIASYALQHGIGASPVLWRSVVIVAVDGRGGLIAAYDRKTGAVVWKTPRSARDAYSTPRVGQLAGRPQLVIHGGDATRSYDPDTGQELWFCEGPADTCANTPVFGAEHVYVSAGYPQKWLLCIKADGAGDVTSSHVVWRDKRRVGYVTSGLLHDGRLYWITDGGHATCYDAATGEQHWRERLRESFSASPVLAGGRIYVGAEDGTTFVLQPGDRFEVLGKNTLPGKLMATPAFCGPRVYLRSGTTLYCIAGS